MKPNRQLIIEIAKKWPGHEGVNYSTTSNAALLSLIADAVDGDRAKLNPPADPVAPRRPLPDGYELFIPEAGLPLPSDTLGLFRPNERSEWNKFGNVWYCSPVAECAPRQWFFARRIKPAWKLPEPPAGRQWHRVDGWTEDMLPDGRRPLLADEGVQAGDEYCVSITNCWLTQHRKDSPEIVRAYGCRHRTRRPLPVEPTPKSAENFHTFHQVRL